MLSPVFNDCPLFLRKLKFRPLAAPTAENDEVILTLATDADTME